MPGLVDDEELSLFSRCFEDVNTHPEGNDPIAFAVCDGDRHIELGDCLPGVEVNA